jgi:4-hydroxy-2-oxoglutarate aldolase
MIKGIMPPIATPFINNEVAFEKLKENLSRWNKTELSGYVVFGSNGESVYLARDEKLKLIEFVKNNIPDNKNLIAGTGSDSIKETIALTNDAAKYGAETALILTPSFYKGQMKHEAFIKYFTQIADNIKIPLLIYNVPKFTGVSIEAETVAELAEHKNIIGIKNSEENVARLSEIINLTSKDFITIVGTASVLYPGLCMGASGGILALANIAPNECIQIYNYVQTDKHTEAKNLQLKMLAANKAVTAKYGVAGLKAALDLTGFFGGEPRSPLSGLTKPQKEDLINILKKAEIIK